jgi:hypothetical protein
MSDRTRVKSWWQPLGRTTLLACGSLASWGVAAALAADPPSYRTVKDVQQWVPDGAWEVREGTIAVAANTSLADARWAAAEAAKAQVQTAALLAHCVPRERSLELPSTALQIAIDSRPREGRGARATRINVVGIQTQVQLDVSPGQPALTDQLGRLREATAFALLHATELDAGLPPAVVIGLAAHVGQQVPAASGLTEHDTPLLELLGGEQWQWRRAAPGLLREPNELAAGAQRATFLVGGNDAEHAPQTLSALAAALEQRVERTDAAGRGSGVGTQVSRRQLETRLAALAAPHQADFEAWLKDPLLGQPEFTPDDKLPADVVAQQRDMLVVLKLQRRVGASAAAASPVKVATFDRQQGRTVRGEPSPREPASIASLAARLRDPLQPTLATIDADGSLLLSTDRERLNELLGSGGERYKVERSGDAWTLAARLADGRVLRGYLAENPGKPNRPLAKFTIEAASGGNQAKLGAKSGDAAASVR